MDIKEELENADEGLQIGPLIDVVFLLLIYFIVTSTLRSPEADLGISLPGSLAQSTTLDMPDEQIIEINPEGSVNLNNFLFENDGENQIPELVKMLIRFRQQSENTNNRAMVTIQADNATSHQRVIDVMNACAAAGIKHVTVGMGE
jgi:biopolymer transport protein ExbD